MVKKEFILILLISLLVLTCGKSPLEKGDQAFQQGQYSQALQFYQEALKQNPDDSSLKIKIARTYFRLGKQLYETRKVLSAFEARVEKGLTYLPAQLDDTLKSEVSQIYFDLAMAYKNALPENPTQKRQFFDKTLAYLEKAVEIDPTNQEAANALQAFHEENFAEMLEKGKDALTKGKKDAEMYLAADYYLTNALKFKPDNAEAKKLLKVARTRALNVLDLDLPMPFVITDQLKKGNLVAYYVILRNNTTEVKTVNAGQFVLLTDDGSEIPGMSSDQFASPFKQVELNPDIEAEGVVAFEVPAGKTPTRVEYREDGTVMGYKNLP